MKVQLTVVPPNDPRGREHPLPLWPDGWPVPRLGDEVRLADGAITRVHVVEWLPHGEHGSDPFVYVVLRAER